MTSQAPSTNVPQFIDIGNAIVYYAPSPQTSFSNAQAATNWRRLGVMKSGVQVQISKELVDVRSGTPQRLIKRFYTQDNLMVSGELLECSPFNLSRLLGGATLTSTVKASAPAATTVATGSTKSVIKVASASGYAADDLIRVGDSAPYQYGVIKTIAGNDLTLYEGLDGDATPTTGHALAKVDTMALAFGQVAAPASVSLKLSKTMVGGFGTIDLYILNCLAEANTTLGWQDNGTQEPVGMPFSFEAVSDPDIEGGSFAQALWTQS